METSVTDEVLLEVNEGVGEVILNRPARKNAITGPLGRGLAEKVNEASAREDVRVVLLRGAEGAFCSGLDLGEFNADPAPDWLPEFQHVWRGAHKALFNCKKPVVGALQRYAINGGAALALACDLLVSGREAFLQVGEVQIGMAAPYNIAWLSLRHSEQVMAQVAVIGDRLKGDDLARLGLAVQIVDDAQVLDVARALSGRLAGYPEGGLMRIKAGLRARLDYGADAWFDRFTQMGPVGGSPKPSSMKGR
jgi:enoyl-CoA hydratase/carnithine racemase